MHFSAVLKEEILRGSAKVEKICSEQEISSCVPHFWNVDFKISEVLLHIIDKQSTYRGHGFSKKPQVVCEAVLTLFFFFF